MVSEVTKLNRRLGSLYNRKNSVLNRIEYWKSQNAELNQEIRSTKDTIHSIGGTVKRAKNFQQS